MAHRVLKRGRGMAARFLFLGAGILAAIAGCKQDPPPPAPPATTPASAPATGPSTGPTDVPPQGVRAGWLIGRIRREDGEPIDGSQVTMQVSIRGIGDNGEPITLTPKVEADGTYQVMLPRGTYRQPSGQIDFSFNQDFYRSDLHPVQANGSRLSSADGIRQDLVWKLSGLRAGQTADPDSPTPWYGGTIFLVYNAFRPDLNRNVAPPPDGTQIVLTLKPVGQLPDGRERKPLSFTRQYNALKVAVQDRAIPDVPLAVYELTMHEVLPDKTEQKLLIQNPSRQWVESVKGTFAPDRENKRVEPQTVQFSRPVGGR